MWFGENIANQIAVSAAVLPSTVRYLFSSNSYKKFQIYYESTFTTDIELIFFTCWQFDILTKITNEETKMSNVFDSY